MLNIQHWFRQWFGINTIFIQNQNMRQEITNLRNQIELIKESIVLHNSVLAKIEGKFNDTSYMDELDPRRQAASSTIGKLMLARRESELKISRQYDGT